MRDADDNNNRLSPEYRWNLLDVSWSEAGCPSVIPAGGSCTGNFYIQNTGTEIWADGRVTFSHHGWQPLGIRDGEIETASALGQDVAPGSVITIPMTLNAPGNAARGDRYRLRFEMWLDDGMGDWIGFSEAEPERPWPTYDVSVCVGACLSYLPTILKNWDSRCEAHPEYWYPVGVNTCDPPVSNCAEGDGEPDGIWAGPFDVGSYHQVEFSPQLVQNDTEIATNWKKYSGDYGSLHLDAKLNDVWVEDVYTSGNQGTPVWKWENAGIGQYEGQYLSGIRFRVTRSNQIAKMQFIVDGYRMKNFMYCTE